MIVKHNISDEDYAKLLKVIKVLNTTVKDACRFMINNCLSDYYCRESGIGDIGEATNIVNIDFGR